MTRALTVRIPPSPLKPGGWPVFRAPRVPEPVHTGTLLRLEARGTLRPAGLPSVQSHLHITQETTSFYVRLTLRTTPSGRPATREDFARTVEQSARLRYVVMPEVLTELTNRLWYGFWPGFPSVRRARSGMGRYQSIYAPRGPWTELPPREPGRPHAAELRHVGAASDELTHYASAILRVLPRWDDLRVRYTYEPATHPVDPATIPISNFSRDDYGYWNHFT